MYVQLTIVIATMVQAAQIS